MGRPPGSKNKKPPLPKASRLPARILDPDEPVNKADAISSAPVETTEATERALMRVIAAAIVGVSPSLINQWCSNGAIKTNPNGDIPISEIRRKTIEWYKKNLGKRSGDEGEDAIDAKTRGEKAKASLAELDLEERLGNLVSRTAAKNRMVDTFNMVKTRFMGMPEAFAAELASKTNPQDVREFLTARFHEVLTDLAGDNVTASEN